MPLLTLGTTTIPALGFGTGTTWFKGAQGEDALIASLQAALDMGVRHIDEAEMYANEEVCTRQRGGVWTEWWTRWCMLLGGLVVTYLPHRGPFLTFPRSHIRLPLTATLYH